MKELTHYAFSAGASLYCLSVLGQLSLLSISVALWLSFSVNYTIDALGHSMFGTPSRTRLTHSVFTAPLWGALISSTSIYILSREVSSGPLVAVLGFWTGAGVLVSLGHLFLDCMTEAGVYYWRGRVAIAHFRYDNAPLNAGFIFAGLGLAASAVLQTHPTTLMPPIALSFVKVLAFTA